MPTSDWDIQSVSDAPKPPASSKPADEWAIASVEEAKPAAPPPVVPPAPAMPVMGMYGVPLPAAPESEQINLGSIVQGTKRNLLELLRAAGPFLRQNPDAGGIPSAPPPTVSGNPQTMTPSDVQTMGDALQRPVVPLADGAQPGSFMHGVLSGAESLTTPENAAIVAATTATGGVLGGLAKGLTGYPLVSVKALNLGLSALFTSQMGHAMAVNVAAAYDAWKRLDYPAVADHLGAGSVDALFTAFGITHGVSSVNDLLKTKVPRPQAPAPGPSGPYAKEQQGVPASQPLLDPAAGSAPPQNAGPQPSPTPAPPVDRYAAREAKATEYLQQNPNATIADIQKQFKLGFGRAARVFQAVRGEQTAKGEATRNDAKSEPVSQPEPEPLGKPENNQNSTLSSSEAPDWEVVKTEPAPAESVYAEDGKTPQSNPSPTFALSSSSPTPMGHHEEKEKTEQTEGEETSSDPNSPIAHSSENWSDEPIAERITPAPTQHPVTYLTGSHNPNILEAAKRRGDIGLMVSPLKPDYLAHADQYPVIAIDNGVFSKTTPFNPKKFSELVDRAAADPAIKSKVRFVVAPDVVGDAEGTLALYKDWADKIHAKGLPVAFALQNGAENMADRLPWDKIDALFIGGSTDWKIGNKEAFEDQAHEYRWINLFKEAKQRNIPIHMGRVNSAERLHLAEYGLGVSSVDGTYLAYGPSKNQPHLEDWLNVQNKREDLDTARTPVKQVDSVPSHPSRPDADEWTATHVDGQPIELAVTKSTDKTDKSPLAEQATRFLVDSAAKGDAEDERFPPTRIENAEHVTRVEFRGWDGKSGRAIHVIRGTTPAGEPVVGSVHEYNFELTDDPFLPEWFTGPEAATNVAKTNRFVSKQVAAALGVPDPYQQDHDEEDEAPSTEQVPETPAPTPKPKGKGVNALIPPPKPKADNPVVEALSNIQQAIDDLKGQLTGGTTQENAGSTTIESNDTGASGEARSPDAPVRTDGDGALAGRPTEDVSGTGGDGQAVSGSVGGGSEHAGDDANLDDSTEQSPAGSSGGTGVPDVVSHPPRTRTPEVRPNPTPTSDLSGDFRLTPEQAAEIESGGAKTRARNNLEAIRTIKQIIADGNRAPTLAEQQKIARFVGWGMSEMAQGMFTGYKSEWAGLRENLRELLTKQEIDAAEESTKNAHYTRRDVAHAMWQALKRMGFHAGQSVIEPGMGIGNFFMMMPEELMPGTSRTGVELDQLTGAMARALFPGSNILVKPYQQTSLPDNYFDAAIGNVPFANHAVVDPTFKRQPALTQNVHNYFFAKTMQKLRPGGVMIAITSRYTMDGQATAFRKWMDEHAELLGAIRLPRDTFKENAGTSVTVDLIVLRKRMTGQVPIGHKWIDSKPLKMGENDQVNVNEYFHDHPEMMMGEMRPGTQYARGYPELFGEFTLEKLRTLLSKLPADVMPDWAADTGARDQLVENYPDAQHIKEHQYGVVNGVVVQREGGKFKPVPLTGRKLDRMRGLIDLRGVAREVIRTQQMDRPDAEILKARADLNKQYSAFVAEYGPVNSIANALVFAADPDWPVVSGLLEDFDKDAWRGADKKLKDKGTWSVVGRDVQLALGKVKAVIARTRDIFHKRTIEKPQRIEHVDTAAEALAVSLNELGRMDWDRMQELTGRDPEALQQELMGRIFRNPTSNKWETEDEYLSGNVRQKLRDAQFIAQEHPEYKANAEALEKVLPRWKPALEIKAGIGATWVPDTDYSQFAAEVLKVENPLGNNNEGPFVTYVPATGTFALRSAHYHDGGVANTSTFGNAYFTGWDLFEKALNGKAPVAKDTEYDIDGKEYEVKNPDATIDSVERQTKLRDEFTKWLWHDAERAQRLETKFNEEINNLRLREHDGSHLTFPGLNKSWLRSGDPEPHQKNAVWRTIQTGNTLYAHVVGAGKTLEAIMASMELRRLGMRKKNMIVVPNHLVQQWRDDWMRAYPGAQILVPTKKDFKKEHRKRLMARIASGNYDGVIVGHKSFEKIGVKAETFKAFVDEELSEINDALEAARAGLKQGEDEFKNPTIKQLRSRKASLEAKLEKRLKKDEKDDALTFEELGVDQLFVDEADLFKNLGFTTMMDRVAGLPNSDSDRATDMLLKTRFVSNLHGGDKGVVFMTGTPVSNSIAEVWTMMRYLMPNYLKREGFDTFDSWAKTFGETRTQMEVAPEGGRFIQRTRFSKFRNAAQMMAMFRLVADIRTAKQLNLPTPAVFKGGYVDVVAPASEALKRYVEHIGERADAVRNGEVKPEEDNMLKISSDGRKASLDMRLVHPGLPDDPKSKPNQMVKHILDTYKEFAEVKGTQLVFLDLGTPKSEKSKRAAASASSQVANKDEDEDEDIYDEKPEGDEEEESETAEEAVERATVYQDIKNKLIAGGIPAEEIAFAQEAKTEAQKQSQFDAMNSGKIRVLMGSTEKMGAGTNVQRRLVALHHGDAPWRPRDMQQRDGRIVRQGNHLYDNGLIKSVRLFRYMTEGSFDAFMWETLSSKAAPIEQLMEGDPSMDDVEELSPVVLSYEQAKAISSGNPAIREKIILDQDIHKLEVLRGQWLAEQASIGQQLATLPAQTEGIRRRIGEYEEDIATREANPDFIVGGRKYDPQAVQAAEALDELLHSMGPVSQSGRAVDATYRGFPLVTSIRSITVQVRTAKGRGARSFTRALTADNKYLYGELHDIKDVQDIKFKHFDDKDLKITPLSEAEANQVHADWDKTFGDAATVPWRSAGDIYFYDTPGARLVMASGTHTIGSESRTLTPKGILGSLAGAVQVDNFLKTQQDELRRHGKKLTELESKYGDPFQYAEKLQTMKRRQAELAVELGETADDKEALRAAEEAVRDPNSPIRRILDDPQASMYAKWFPRRKWQGTNSNGSKYVVKGHPITEHLGVYETKSGSKRIPNTWNVGHILSGGLVRGGFRHDWYAVDYARKLEKALDWNWTKPPEGFEDKLRDFNNKWEPPTEQPQQSRLRVLADDDDRYTNRDEGEESLDHGSGPRLVRRGEGERGFATPDFLTAGLAKKLQELFHGKDGEPLRDYSFMGAAKSRFLRNLSQLEEAAPEAHEAVVRAASWQAQAATLLRAAWPKVVKALGTGTTDAEFRLGLIQSRLYGTRDRWKDLADVTLQTPNDKLLDWVLGGPLQLLAAMSEDGDVAQQAAALAANIEVLPKNKLHRRAYENLRRLVSESFLEAADNVKDMMTEAQFAQLTARPGFQDALDVYHSEIEPQLAESHQRNEGVFSDSLGPLDTYYPLTPIRANDQAAAITGARRGFRKPANISNGFTTGLADDYDSSLDAFAEKVGAALRINDKAAAIQALMDAGIVRKLAPGQAAQTVKFQGKEYAAKIEEVGPARTIVQPDGKVLHIAPQRVAVPEPFWHELQPVLFAKTKLPPGVISRVLGFLTHLTLSGPADMVFHSHNLLGALVANTPWLGESLAEKTIGNTPLTKVATALIKIVTTDPMDDNAIGDLQAMAKLGLLPERFGRETFSKEYSLMTGAKLKRWYLGQFGPTLYGPKGIDVRARLIMYRLAKQLDPHANSVEIYKFVTQLGNYTESLQSHLERSIKSTGLSPFYTAGSTMMRNGIDAWLGTGSGSGPGGGAGRRLAQMLSAGAIGVVALWVLSYYAMRGKFPWQDKQAHFLKMPVSGQLRRSKVGTAIWGKDYRKDGQINFGFASPLVSRGARALGIQGAADTALAGGNGRQVLQGAKKDIVNSAIHPLAGPVVRGGFMLATGKEPYLVNDRQGGLTMMSGIPKKAPIGVEAKYALRELNSFYGNVAAAVGFEGPHDAGGSAADHVLRAVVDMTGLTAPASNPWATRKALADERRTHK